MQKSHQNRVSSITTQFTDNRVCVTVILSIGKTEVLGE